MANAASINIRTNGLALGSAITPGRANHHKTANQTSKPTANKYCQPRPSSRYSQPWFPNQNHQSPSICSMPSHSPSKLPQITATKATNKKLAQGNKAAGVFLRKVVPKNKAAAT